MKIYGFLYWVKMEKIWILFRMRKIERQIFHSTSKKLKIDLGSMRKQNNMQRGRIGRCGIYAPRENETLFLRSQENRTLLFLRSKRKQKIWLLGPKGEIWPAGRREIAITRITVAQHNLLEHNTTYYTTIQLTVLHHNTTYYTTIHPTETTVHLLQHSTTYFSTIQSKNHVEGGYVCICGR